MYIKFKASATSAMLAAACVLLLSGFATPEEKNKVAAATKECMDDANNPTIVPETGNPVVDFRCRMVAVEVCVNKKTGFISQSQGTKKQCEIIQGLGGVTACKQPCSDAKHLPVGGNGVVGNYRGLTSAAVSCYDETRKRIGGVDSKSDACNQNIALQCLMNASSSLDVNAAILRERKSGCKSFYNTYGGGCVACSGEKLRVDYDPSIIDLDSEHCTPALAAKKHCTMP